MKNKVFGITVMFMVIVFSVVACDKGSKATSSGTRAEDAALNGVWKPENRMLSDLIFNNGVYEIKSKDATIEKGTYKVTDQKLTVTKTHGINYENGKLEKKKGMTLPGEITGENTFVYLGNTFTRSR